MSTTRRNLGLVRSWLKNLGSAIAIRVQDREAVKRAQALAGIVGQGLPDAAFTPESLTHVLNQTTGEPGAAAISTALKSWWATHAPEDPNDMPADIAASSLSMEDKIWCRNFRRAAAHERENMLSTIRRYSGAAFGWLFAEDVDAFQIARARGWSPRPIGALAEEWSRPDTIQRAIDNIMGLNDDGPVRLPTEAEVQAGLRMLRAIVTKWAPDNLHLIPDPMRPIQPPVAGQGPTSVETILNWE